MTEERGALRQTDGSAIAYGRVAGRGPTLVWLSGFRSDMSGTKAQRLTDLAQAQGRAMVRFDYRGHGASQGDFLALGIEDWLGDALLAIDRLTDGPLVLVGSSMGGWLALLCALERPERVQSLLLIAPAPDFSETLWDQLSEAERAQVEREGRILRPSEYGDPYPMTRALFEQGRRRLLMRAPIPVSAPLRILHGQADDAVPWRQSLDIVALAAAADVRVTLIKDGDHRLSREGDLVLLTQTAQELLGA